MTDREALLRCVIESPQDDLPRLVMADWLEENGEPERAEFIRVQVELARPIGQEYVNVEEIRDLRRRERELLDATPFGMRDANRWAIQEGMPTDGELEWSWSRGFISSLTCDWKMFRRHASALIWHPEDTTECSKCGGHKSMILEVALPGYGVHQTKKRIPAPCKACGGDVVIEGGKVVVKDGTGKVRRPFPSTAQPIETVRLTSFGDVHNGEFDEDEDGNWISIATDNGVARFTRVKCPTCGGMGAEMRLQRIGYVPCLTCHGTPPNRWTCDSYRGVVFEMPDARQPWQGFP